jgi:hypothetical protein
MNLRKAVTLAFATVALALVPAVSASAGPTATEDDPAALGVVDCTFVFHSLKAVNLRHDGDHDRAWLKIDDTFYPAGNKGVLFYLGTSRDNTYFNIPPIQFGSEGLDVAVVTDDFPFNHSIAKEIECSTVEEHTTRFDDGDAKYDLTYSVEATPTVFQGRGDPGKK